MKEMRFLTRETIILIALLTVTLMDKVVARGVCRIAACGVWRERFMRVSHLAGRRAA